MEDKELVPARPERQERADIFFQRNPWRMVDDEDLGFGNEFDHIFLRGGRFMDHAFPERIADL